MCTRKPTSIRGHRAGVMFRLTGKAVALRRSAPADHQNDAHAHSRTAGDSG